MYVYYNIHCNRAFVSFRNKEFCIKFDDLAFKAAEYQNSSKFGRKPYGNGCHTSTWLSEAKTFRVECTKHDIKSKIYLVSFWFHITSRDIIASGSASPPHVKKYFGTLSIELPRKWTQLTPQGILFKSYSYFNYEDKEWDEKTDADPVEDLEHRIEKEFERRTEWKPAKEPDITVVVHGSADCGKTSYVHRLVLDKFPQVKWPFEQRYF